jgi:hypothetical protein
MNRFSRWYGAGPLHLLTMIGSFALAGYAAAELLPNNAVGIPVWLVGAVIAHDLILFPLYTLADRSAVAVLGHRPGRLPAVPWINYLRVPAVLSGILLLIWFPLILRLPTRFPATTALPLDPYLWHWLAVTGALFLLSAAALAVRLRAVQAGDKQHEEGGHQEQERQAEEEEERKAADAPQVSPLPDTADTPAGAAPGTPSPDPAVSEEAIRPAGIARLGTVLPDTPLLDGHGRATTLYTAVGDGPSVLDPGHAARWIHVHPDDTTRADPHQVIDALDQLGY